MAANMVGQNNPAFKHGLRNHPLYWIWAGMKQRCTDKRPAVWPYYGAKGITVCEEWMGSFTAFFNWCGSAGWKRGLTIDRINNSAGYTPSNCRFVSWRVQQRNRTDTHLVTHRGETLCLKAWAEKFGINYRTLFDRINRGWSFEDAIYSKPDKHRSRRHWSRGPSGGRIPERGHVAQGHAR